MARVCLNMIVKDEAHVLRRCLRSVRSFIDGWAIVDTGSTDGTQALIQEELEGLPGELFERPWVDFGHNRTEAIALAGSQWDYLYFIDADEELVLPEGWTRPELNAPAYLVKYLHDSITYQRPSLVSARLPWRYVGVLHEHLDCGQPVPGEPLDGPLVIYRAEGARSLDPLKFQRDAEVLERALRAEPANTRYRFYLAQSHRDAGNLETALDQYRHRARQGGWAEEVYVSLLQAARLLERLGRPPAEVGQAYLAAHTARPSRAEALVDLARFFREQGDHATAYRFARKALDLPPSPDILFVEPEATGWRAQDEAAVSAYWVGRPAECRDRCRALLASGALPQDQVPRVATNLDYALRALGESG